MRHTSYVALMSHTEASPLIETSTFRLIDQLANVLPIAIIATDTDGIVHCWSEAATALYGWSRDETIGNPIYRFTVGPLDHSLALDIVRQVNSGQPWQGVFHARTKHGAIVKVNVADFPIVLNGVIVGIAGMSLRTDDNQRGNTLHDAKSSAGLRELAREVRDVRRRERIRLATVLHDDVGQNLSVARSEILAARENAGHIDSAFHHALRHLDLVNTRVRQEVGDLLSEEVDVWEFLLQTVEVLEEMQDRAQMLTSFTIHASVDELRMVRPTTAATALAIVREACRNCERHSGANVVAVSIGVIDGTLRLAVEDNGRGIDDSVSGSGTALMHERAKLARGSLNVSRRSDTAGTRVAALLPVGGGN